MRCACELAHPFEPPGAVLVVEPHDVFSGVSDERPLRDDGIALRLTGVQDDACAFIAGDEPQQADALPLGTIEPTHLTDREICCVCADPSRADLEALAYARGQLSDPRGLPLS